MNKRLLKIKKKDWNKFEIVKNRFVNYYNELYNKENFLYSRKNKELYIHRWHLTINKIIEYMNLNGNEDNVLEIGCGWGRIILGLMRQIPNIKISAIDTSDISISTCKKILSQERINVSINFKIGSAEKIPYKNNSFDNIIAIRVFQFLEDPLLAVKEAKRVLKNKGKLILILPNKYNPKQALFYRTKLYKFSQMKNWFEKCNFKHIKLETYCFIPGHFKNNFLILFLENLIGYIPILNKLGGLVIISGTKNE